MKKAWYVDSPIGKLGIAEDGIGICNLTFDCKELSELTIEQTPLLVQAEAELAEYFAGKRITFELPLSLAGTPFQQAVWKALQTIPYGTVCSYQDIAKQVGSPKGCRAVGMANNRNPVAIIVPCHRVIGKDGSLVGYGGGMGIKTFLLKLEQEKR